jgi:Tfp pilus assembly protein PilN
MRAVNLLPRDERRRPGKPSIQAQLTMAAPFVAGGLLAVGTMMTGAKVTDRRAELQALQAQLAAIPRPTKQQAVDPKLAAESSQRVAALADALHQRVAWDRILREVSSVLPDDVWLTTLRVQSGSVTPGATATVPTGGLSITGYTYSQPGVARFLARLGIVPEINNVVLKSSNEVVINGRKVVQFQVDAAVNAAGNG